MSVLVKNSSRISWSPRRSLSSVRSLRSNVPCGHLHHSLGIYDLGLIFLLCLIDRVTQARKKRLTSISVNGKSENPQKSVPPSPEMSRPWTHAEAHPPDLLTNARSKRALETEALKTGPLRLQQQPHQPGALQAAQSSTRIDTMRSQILSNAPTAQFEQQQHQHLLRHSLLNSKKLPKKSNNPLCLPRTTSSEEKPARCTVSDS